MDGRFPPEVRIGLIGRPIPDHDRLAGWRDPVHGFRLVDESVGLELVGVLDDVVVDHEVYLPLVYRAARSQSVLLDCAALLLEANGCACIGIGFRLDWTPCVGEGGRMGLALSVRAGRTPPARARRPCRQALSTRCGPLPARSPGCRECQALRQLKRLERE